MNEHLLEALAEVDRPGDVFAAGDLPPAMPGLEVEGIGTVGLPLSKTQARALVRRCRQAPYGKGTRTLVDTGVRRVWEMDPAHFELTNPKWEALIRSILDEVRQCLGLEDRKLAAHLYKLLLYEKGSFFLPHRDGERLDAMVATLIVALPSKHEGGALVVRHEGREHEIAFPGAASGLELSWAAFYADCPHEVRPLRSGYRLCLVYNVTLARTRRKKGLGAPSWRAVTARVAELLGAWRESDGTDKRVVTLEHQYTEDGLAPDRLKGADRARAEVLFDAAEQAGCVAHLALITLWQLGDVDHDYGDYSYRRRRRYGSRYSDDHDEDRGSDYEMGEIIDTSLTASHWSDRHGNAHQLGEIQVDDDEVVSGDPLDDGEPSEEDFEDYTGNAGMTLERWYHRAAIVIWPRDRHFAVLCGAGTEAAVGGLEAMVKALRQGSKAQREATRRDCLQFAGAIIDGWQSPGTRWIGNDDKFGRSLFSKLLCRLDDPGLMRRFLSEIVPGDGGAELHRDFAKLGRRHGLRAFEAELAQTIDAASPATLLRNAQLLHLLCRQPDHDKSDAAVCTRLCRSAVAALERLDAQPPENAWEARKLDRTALLVTLVSAMAEIGAQRPLRSMLNHALADQEHYDLTDTHLAAIFKLAPRLGALSPSGKADKAIAYWLSACRRELKRRTARAPQAPADWRRDAELSCKCADCRALGRFLADPNERECRMPLAKERRRHLHGIIETNRCDVTHVTERRGRPFTLVCTKTTASYERACKTFERDKRNLARVVGIEEGLG